MLTEELRRKSILQLYYYPVFLFQRLVIAGIIVFVYEYPYIQVFTVILTNVLMLGFLLIIKPFKEENQRATTIMDELIIMTCVSIFIFFLYDPEMEE